MPGFSYATGVKESDIGAFLYSRRAKYGSLLSNTAFLRQFFTVCTAFLAIIGLGVMGTSNAVLVPITPNNLLTSRCVDQIELDKARVIIDQPFPLSRKRSAPTCDHECSGISCGNINSLVLLC